MTIEKINNQKIVIDISNGLIQEDIVSIENYVRYLKLTLQNHPKDDILSVLYTQNDSFNFLENEPNVYGVDDCKEVYAG